MRYDKVTVPAQVLQDLIWNIELGVSNDHDMLIKQCEKLQNYLNNTVTTGHTRDSNIVYANFGRK